MRRDVFQEFHPVINLMYFAIVLIMTMSLMHPVFLLISFSSSLAYLRLYMNRKEIRQRLFAFLFLAVFACIVNAAFNHRGITILTYLPSGNPLTLESILYGLATSLMLYSAFNYFTLYQRVISTDKSVYLFGRIAPSLSLLASMTLRFVPLLQSRADEVATAQANLRGDGKSLSGIAKIRYALRNANILINWSLERAIETADSMRSRGYGLPGRTAFHNFNWTDRDRFWITALVIGGWLLIAGGLAGSMTFNYYPRLSDINLDAWGVFFAVLYFCFSLIPVYLNWKEAVKWHYIKLRN